MNNDRHPLMMFILLGALSWVALAGQPEQIRQGNVEFVLYWVDLNRDTLSLHWKDAQGKPLESFSRLREHLASQSRELKFAINSGIYARDKVPLGLHVEQSKRLRGLNLGDLEGGQGNFYLKPNGVFFVDGHRPGILESGQFARQAIHPLLACQSGPLLLSNRVIHPAFQPNSTSLRVRSGVGMIQGTSRIVFVLSRQPLCFHDFARLFKEKLGCDHALFLDGEICAVYLPELGYTKDAPATFVGLFAVTTPRARRGD